MEETDNKVMGKTSGSKWSILAFLCGIFVVYTIDRALLGILAIPIQSDTGISDVRFGLLSSAIFWTYALCVPFAGLVGDRFDRRKVVAAAVVFWSVMTLLAGFANGFWSLLALASVAVVVPQTLYGPSANALIASLHKETRTIAMSLHQAAYYTGWFLSGAVVALILSLFGTWRAAFFVFGGLGIVLGFLFRFFTRSAQTAQTSQTHQPSHTFRKSFAAYFGCPSALLAASGYVLLVFVGCGYGAWGPKFVAQKFGLSAGAAGAGVMFWHYAVAFGAVLATGWVTDRMVGRFPRFRLATQIVALVLAAPVLSLFAFGSALVQVWTAAAIFGVLRGAFEANQFTSVFDVVPAEFRASAIGFTNVIAGTVGACSPLLLGWLSQTRGLRGFEVGFAFLGATLLVAAALMSVSFLFTFRRDRMKEVS